MSLGPRSLSDLRLSCCGKAEFGHILRKFLLNNPIIRRKFAQNLPQIGLSLATDAQVRQAPATEAQFAAQERIGEDGDKRD